MMKRFLQQKNTRMYHVWLRSFMVCLCLALAGVSAWGQTLEGKGTKEEPYQLDSKEDLEWFRNHVNDGHPEACAILTADIDLNPAFEIKENGTCIKRLDYSGPEIEEPEEWKPIMDNYTLSYTGTFDGAEHTISGLYMGEDSNADFKGLFAIVGGINPYPFSITNNQGTVKKLTVKGYIVATDVAYTGGICSMNAGTIHNCTNKVNFKAQKIETFTNTIVRIGGIACSNYDTISECINEGEINSMPIIDPQNDKYQLWCGGICSDNYGKIEKCYNEGYIENNSNMGVTSGISAYSTIDVVGATSSNPIITNCYNVGTLSGGEIGGICHVRKGNATADGCATITYCHNYGELKEGEITAGICIVCKNSEQSEDPEYEIKNTYYNDRYAESGMHYSISGPDDDIIEDEPGKTESKSVEAFANGEVLYLLQQDNPDVWEQTVDLDLYPVFKASETPTTIYKVSVVYDETMGSVTGEGFNGKEGFYAAGSTVNLKAEAKDGFKFIEWMIDNQDVVTSESYTIEGISKDIELKAIFEELPETYTVKVIDGFADNLEYEQGETVTITANEAPEGKVFAGWTTDDENITFADINQATTTFIMPANDVTVTATFKEKEDPTDPEEPVDPPVDPINYYNIYNETTYDFIDVSFSRNVVREGGSVNVYLEIPEGLDPAAVTLMFKRGMYDGWRTLDVDDEGNYRIDNIWTHIYVKAVVDESYIDPEPDENHIYIDLSETNDSIWLYTDHKLVEEGKTAVIQAEVAKSCQNKEIRYMYKRTVLGEWKEMPKDYSINQYVVRDITTDIYVKAYFVFDKQDPTTAKNPHHVYADITATCEGLYLDATRHKVADEGDTKVFLYVKKGFETKDARYLFKRGLKGEWEDLVPGIEQNTFQVTDIEGDIYLKGIDAVYTGTEDIDGMVRVYTKDGSLFVYTAQPEEISVVSMTGVTVKRTRQTGLQSYPLSQGIYVVCVGEQVFKVRVK